MGKEATLAASQHKHRLSWGIVTAHVSESKEGRVHAVLLFSDTLAYQLLVCAQTEPVTRDTALATFIPHAARELHAWLASTHDCLKKFS
jgi:hypothetical protein